jgi:hypothetical protein
MSALLWRLLTCPNCEATGRELEMVAIEREGS